MENNFKCENCSYKCSLNSFSILVENNLGDTIEIKSSDKTSEIVNKLTERNYELLHQWIKNLFQENDIIMKIFKEFQLNCGDIEGLEEMEKDKSKITTDNIMNLIESQNIDIEPNLNKAIEFIDSIIKIRDNNFSPFDESCLIPLYEQFIDIASGDFLDYLIKIYDRNLTPIEEIKKKYNLAELKEIISIKEQKIPKPISVKRVNTEIMDKLTEFDNCLIHIPRERSNEKIDYKYIDSIRNTIEKNKQIKEKYCLMWIDLSNEFKPIEPNQKVFSISDFLENKKSINELVFNAIVANVFVHYYYFIGQIDEGVNFFHTNQIGTLEIYDPEKEEIISLIRKGSIIIQKKENNEK